LIVSAEQKVGFTLKSLRRLRVRSLGQKGEVGKAYGFLYYGEPKRSFLHLNKAADGIMRKDTIEAKITEIEMERNKKISKKRYIVEQYFGLRHLYDGAYRARFTTMMKYIWDGMCREMGFNMFTGSKLLAGT
jgi:hypothetical protein